MTWDPEVPGGYGVEPIPSGHVRLYHFTAADPEEIRRHGLLLSKARGPTYGEPAWIWGTTRGPSDTTDSGRTAVEYHIPATDPAIGTPWGGVTDVRGQPIDDEGLREFEQGQQHVGIARDIKPEEIVAIHEPWHHTYRYLKDGLEDAVKRGEYDDILTDPRFDRDEGKAIRRIKAEAKAHWRNAATDQDHEATARKALEHAQEVWRLVTGEEPPHWKTFLPKTAGGVSDTAAPMEGGGPIEQEHPVHGIVRGAMAKLHDYVQRPPDHPSSHWATGAIVAGAAQVTTALASMPITGSGTWGPMAIGAGMMAAGAVGKLVAHEYRPPPKPQEPQLPKIESSWRNVKLGRVMYHFAPPEERENIRAHGIDWRHSIPASSQWRDQYFQEQHLPRGNYLWKSHLAPDPSVGETQGYDMWAVDTSGMHLKGDPHPNYAGRALYSEGPIEPHRLRLVSPAERCWNCSGSGRDTEWDKSEHPCELCGGDGLMGKTGPQCGRCNGSGKTVGNPCEYCEGGGWLQNRYDPEADPSDSATWNEGIRTSPEQWLPENRRAPETPLKIEYKNQPLKISSYDDIREKAKRIRDSGGVSILRHDHDVIAASVRGDHGAYDVELYRQEPAAGLHVTTWSCTCPWADYAWAHTHQWPENPARTRRWRQIEGRMCSHGLATLYEAHSREYTKDWGGFDEEGEPITHVAARQGWGDPESTWIDDPYDNDPHAREMYPSSGHNELSITRRDTGVDVPTDWLYRMRSLAHPELHAYLNDLHSVDRERMDQLKKNLNENGQFNPILIGVNDSSSWRPRIEILDGNHRVQWAHEDNIPSLKAEIRYFGDAIHRPLLHEDPAVRTSAVEEDEDEDTVKIRKPPWSSWKAQPSDTVTYKGVEAEVAGQWWDPHEGRGYTLHVPGEKHKVIVMERDLFPEKVAAWSGEGPWYHGTNKEFAPGDEVRSGEEVGEKAHGEFSDSTKVWVSNIAWRAGAYGHRVYLVEPWTPPKAPYQGHDEHRTTGATVVRELTTDEIRNGVKEAAAPVCRECGGAHSDPSDMRCELCGHCLFRPEACPRCGWNGAVKWKNAAVSA